MTDGTCISIEELLNHNDVKSMVDDVSQEIMERRNHKPLICKVFKTPYTTLEDQGAYSFNIDQETRKQLPKIIGNKVQKVIGWESGSGDIKTSIKEK